MNAIIRSASRRACKSRHPFYWHVAVVLRHGRPLAFGTNRMGLHAEVNALRGLAQEILSTCEIVSLRFNRAGNLRLAKPCDNCMDTIARLGIKRIVYSDEIGGMITIA
jgi:tRNA(Arg) A34 adenosine deaminase TadA